MGQRGLPKTGGLKGFLKKMGVNIKGIETIKFLLKIKSNFL